MNNNIKATAMDSVTELSPKIKRARSTFNLGIRDYTSFNIGDLVPLGGFTEVLPGDTFSVDLSTFIRLTSTAKRPTMDNLHMDIYAFFVPYRFLDDKWVNIQGENDKAWAAPAAYCSQVDIGTVDIEKGSLANHLGLPIGSITSDDNVYINIYPFYAYYKIVNDWFRDENLQDEIAFDTSNASYDKTDLPLINLKAFYEAGGLFKVAKYHDVYTSALPAPQKGPSVSLLKAEGKAPVGILPSATGTLSGTNTYPNLPVGQSVVSGQFSQFKLVSDAGVSGLSSSSVVADVSQAYVTTINELRLAFQLQKAYELDARSGTRYTEALEARFGTKNPDLRLGRSEILGHYRFDLNMAEIASTTNTGATGSTVSALKGDSYLNGVGAGASKTGNSQHICVKSFLEHGLFMILGCVRSDLTYQQGIEKFWRKKARWDFYEPIFSNIGEVPIMKSELFGQVVDSTYGWANDSVFGYQEAWYEYRYKQNHVSGILASDAGDGFDIFHYAADFLSAPTLSEAFIQQSTAGLDRTLLFGSSSVDNFICNVQGNIKATRVMPLFSTPGLIDHF